ncbi:hypothetical protein H0G86_003011 [Trichoderma simmonsii]|uniref:Uncharacterized protein n=1 Tax=Trichoderma simmonsii TaxID=1491479 RepID=A0A8G0L4N3_9HYPO|nr:hypothetical protein H0G86_003011 [Trichoderma simmonsii]
MFSTVVSQATRAAFSTSARALKPADASISASARNWRNLSPQSRRYIAYGVATCLAVDGYLVYNYAPWIVGLEKRD